MKVLKRIVLVLVLIFIILIVVGYSLPKEKIVSRKAIYDKMYFFVMADITNHFDEPSWRTDLDTVIQQEDIDGLRVWLEKYTNGDSLLLKTLKVTEADLVRETIEPNRKSRLRIIQLKDLDGKKTAIKMSEEVIIRNPLRRFFYVLDDRSGDFIEQYLEDLRVKYENQGEDDIMMF